MNTSHGDPDGGKCDICGGLLELINWCPTDKQQCVKDCGEHIAIPCQVMEERLKCAVCGVIERCE